MARPYSIVFVCLGNICRSPMAQYIFTQRLEKAGLADDVRVSSAGTGDYHIGETADSRAEAALRSRGYDAAGHRARQFDAHEFATNDLVLALDTRTADKLRRLAPTPEAAAKVHLLRSFEDGAAEATDLDVPDPYFGGEDGFELAMDLIEQAANALVVHVQGELAHLPR